MVLAGPPLGGTAPRGPAVRRVCAWCNGAEDGSAMIIAGGEEKKGGSRIDAIFLCRMEIPSSVAVFLVRSCG
ncbi:hypothetical protein PoB_001604100 [Plakobranchus ocellatus]|uniref:Uncharacterized protein n=1 Tax=Plakobranchus ocellatus TaxID=259542 RepID=A0AAV3Z125_9GAST|nr:hypothetical protein PoB_001604100 [Plakobranchus ocellatus]